MDLPFYSQLWAKKCLLATLGKEMLLLQPAIS